MRISLDFTKSVQENAAVYFEKAKKAKKKKQGAEKALAISRQKLEEAVQYHEQENQRRMKEAREQQVVRKKNWYEKFHWFYSSQGLLVIGGRDVVTNEIVVKKHAENSDLILHTDMAGSPFFVIRAEGKEIDQRTKEEAAAATAIFSRAWKLGFVNVTVRAYNPEDVSKTPKHGEYLARGAFILTGKGQVIEHNMKFVIGIKEGVIISGPYSAIAGQTDIFVEIIQGDEKTSSLAHKIKKIFHTGNLDEIIRMLPAGNGKIKN